MAGGSTKVILISLVANAGIALSKLAGALFTGSAALMAEAVHSASDCGNQALLLYGQKRAKIAPDAKHPLGRGKEAFFWSFVVALLLFTMGGMFSLYEGIHKLQEPEPLTNPLVGVGILVVAVGLEGFSFLACLREVRLINREASLWQWIRKTGNADLLVIFLEDLAALLGLVFALVALVLSWLTGNGFWDGLGSCVIGVLLIAVAVVLAREVKSLLIGETAGVDYQQALQPLVVKHFPQGQLLRVVSMLAGVDQVMLAYKLHPGETDTRVGEVMDRLNALEAEVRSAHPEVRWQFAELDHRD